MYKLILFPLVLFFFISCADIDEVNIYSSRHYDTDVALYDNFTEQTGIKVNLIEGSSDELIERVRNEGLNSPADILITVDAGRLWRAKEAGILDSYDSERIREVISDQMRDPEGYWIGLSERVRGIVYHLDKVDPADLRGYYELGEPQWEGRLCVRSSNNIYNQSMVASMMESYGAERTEAWARRLVQNFARSPQGGDTDQIRAVAAGLCDVALVNHYYLARLMQSEAEQDQLVASSVAIYFPAADFGGTHVNISGAGITAHSPNRDNAVRFLEYLTTDQAQLLYAVGNNEFPVVEGLLLPEELLLFGSYESDLVNVAMYGENNPDAIRIMDRAGWR
ncbi:MAG: Fe(3+) ABC transporter substrate-binding protein [Balneolaceae bacterium]|nr:MAG: Fe(3+) ABC transporter substrate-binding protein [Balneolaceae bacterium]